MRVPGGEEHVNQLPAPVTHPLGCNQVILGVERLQEGVAKRRVVL